jgi:hypothetical protein
VATVHWVATRESAVAVDQVTEQVYAWSNRKRMFSEDQIRVAWDTLGEKGWLAHNAQ